ncbi:hypothetical protein EHRUM3_02200 [Ehrlichia ruminantium]|uniref:Uncharacterized protein n=1 Tax=Ehrlichia ruminantium TaxID=779 RepID=A0A170SH34_EHRRU|nr:hypothetical protein EHRUM3_02200 [Ehrlichia ruminantium]
MIAVFLLMSISRGTFKDKICIALPEAEDIIYPDIVIVSDAIYRLACVTLDMIIR